MTFYEVRVGDRIRIHPATDWFARGAQYATITSKRVGYCHVKLENIGPATLRVKLRYADILEVCK